MVLNVLVHHAVGGWTAAAITLLSAWALGLLSWFLIERPSLSAKKRIYLALRGRLSRRRATSVS